MVELGYAAAAAVGALAATGVRWQTAQAIDAGRPSVDWPTGLPVLTAAPEQYAGRGVHVITLS